ncbi:B12-binding domain-containing radical SAM protein [Candidatus Omnitrophota bacterium]
MRFSRVLLISPSYGYYDPFLPIGLAYIAQSLSDAGIAYQVLDMSLGYKRHDIKSTLKRYKPDLVGISLQTLGHKKRYQLINYIKKCCPSVKIVAGGPHLSTLKKRVLEECQDIDYGIVMYGEQPITELCRGRPLEEIKGLIYRDNNKIILNIEGIYQIQNHSFPKYDGFELSKYLFAADVPIPIVSSRGCPFQCTFCISRIAFGSRFYARSAEDVADEIEYWHKRGRSIFCFLDDNFTLDAERVYLICAEFQKRGLDKLEFRITNGVRADRVDRKLLVRMKEAGFKALSFGVESGSDKILRVLKKQETVLQIESAIKDACELGYQVTLYFLIGSPYETWEDLNASFRLALRYPIYQVRMYNIIPIPNTELFDWIKENNLFVVPPERYLNFSSNEDRRIVFETPELPLKQRRKALGYAYVVSKKVAQRYYRRILGRYGLFGELVSFLAATNLVRRKLVYIPFIKIAIRKAKRFLIPK